MIDIHCHLLPALDDGPREVEESLAMARGLAALGYREIVATPHIPWGLDVWSVGEVASRTEALAHGLSAAGIPVRLHHAAEHHACMALELISQDRLLCYPRGDTFLLEFPLLGPPPPLDQILFLCRIKKKVPVIAHAERYPDIQRDPSRVEDLLAQGASVLVNLTSLIRGGERRIEKTAEQLLRKGLASAVTTDMHSAEEVVLVEEALSLLPGLAGEDARERLLVEGPARIIHGSPGAGKEAGP